jgi:trimeric autotransporter adhesin
VSEAAAVAGAVIAWLGVTLLIASDGRRGVATGLVVLTAGLALAAAAAGQPPLGVAALAAGGAVAAALRLRGGRPGWGMLPPGSTPRLVGAIVVLIGAALVAGSGLASASGGARLAGLAVAAMAAGRVITVEHRWAALGGASALALGLGALGGTTAMVTAALVAAGLGAIDGDEAVEVGG